MSSCMWYLRPPRAQTLCKLGRLDVVLHVRTSVLDVVLLDALLDRLLLLLGASLLVLALLLATLLGLGLSAFGSSLLGSLGRGVNINQGRSCRFGGGTGLRQFILDNVPDAVGRVGIAVAGESG